MATKLSSEEKEETYGLAEGVSATVETVWKIIKISTDQYAYICLHFLKTSYIKNVYTSLQYDCSTDGHHLNMRCPFTDTNRYFETLYVIFITKNVIKTSEKNSFYTQEMLITQFLSDVH